jgi:NAD(P)-dependent dehydrogenase (short-subunit alcohol dehydrogenase family)
VLSQVEASHRVFRSWTRRPSSEPAAVPSLRGRTTHSPKGGGRGRSCRLWTPARFFYCTRPLGVGWWALSGVAVVTGASRGAGKAIALELGRAGWTVFVTGRSTRGHPDSEGIGGTLEETAEGVESAGGKGIPVACDHTRLEEIDRLVSRVTEAGEPLDLLVNNAWGGYERHDLAAFGNPFWEQPTRHWDGMFTAGVRATLVTSARLAPLMIRRGKGLILNTVAWLEGAYLGNLYYDVAKNAIIRMTEGMASELRPHGVSAVVVVPGFMRTERVMAAHAADPFDLGTTESPRYLAKAVVALSNDPAVGKLSGQTLYVADLARKYGFTDEDGRQPPRFKASDEPEHLPPGERARRSTKG